MQRLGASLLGLLFAATPALALAESVAPQQTQVRQLAAAAAALEAQVAALQRGKAIACAALFTKPSVRVGEHVALAWGSQGAMAPGDDPSRSMWPQVGSSDISFSNAGTWTYSFTFYATSGASATCTATIVATAGQ